MPPHGHVGNGLCQLFYSSLVSQTRIRVDAGSGNNQSEQDDVVMVTESPWGRVLQWRVVETFDVEILESSSNHKRVVAESRAFSH